MGRKQVKNKELKTRVPDELRKRFQRAADSEFTDVSELLRQVIIGFVLEYERKQKDEK